MAAQSAAEVLTFPTDPAQFDNDDRISFSRLDNKYIAVQESDGTEFEFDPQLKRWIPVMDEEEEALIRQQQSAYFTGDLDGDTQPSNGKKRKQGDLEVSCARRSTWSRRTTSLETVGRLPVSFRTLPWRMASSRCLSTITVPKTSPHDLS